LTARRGNYRPTWRSCWRPISSKNRRRGEEAAEIEETLRLARLALAGQSRGGGVVARAAAILASHHGLGPWRRVLFAVFHWDIFAVREQERSPGTASVPSRGDSRDNDGG
jgi:hypothetical protein